MQGRIGNSSSSQIKFADDDVKPVIVLTPPNRTTLLGGGGGDENHSDSECDERKVPQILVGRSSVSTSKGLKVAPSGELKKSSQKRKALPAEKEHKRIKRLLRNRVSAQQARERKKAYLSDLEARTKELEQKNVELEEKVSTLQQENVMLRKVIRSTTIRSSSTSNK